MLTEEVASGGEKKNCFIHGCPSHNFFASADKTVEKCEVAPWGLYSPHSCAFQVCSYSRPKHDRGLTVTYSQESQLATWLGQTSLSWPKPALASRIPQGILYLSVFGQLAWSLLLVPSEQVIWGERGRRAGHVYWMEGEGWVWNKSSPGQCRHRWRAWVTHSDRRSPDHWQRVRKGGQVQNKREGWGKEASVLSDYARCISAENRIQSENVVIYTLFFSKNQ